MLLKHRQKVDLQALLFLVGVQHLETTKHEFKIDYCSDLKTLKGHKASPKSESLYLNNVIYDVQDVDFPRGHILLRIILEDEDVLLVSRQEFCCRHRRH